MHRIYPLWYMIWSRRLGAGFAIARLLGPTSIERRPWRIWISSDTFVKCRFWVHRIVFRSYSVDGTYDKYHIFWCLFYGCSPRYFLTAWCWWESRGGIMRITFIIIRTVFVLMTVLDYSGETLSASIGRLQRYLLFPAFWSKEPLSSIETYRLQPTPLSMDSSASSSKLWTCSEQVYSLVGVGF